MATQTGSAAANPNWMQNQPVTSLICKPAPSSSGQKDDGEVRIVMTNGRLEINASVVDLDGLARLKEVLGKYEDILKLMGSKNAIDIAETT